jgi:hypothetical protein
VRVPTPDRGDDNNRADAGVDCSSNGAGRDVAFITTKRVNVSVTAEELLTACPFCGVEGRGIDPEVRHRTVYAHVESVHPHRVEEITPGPAER